MKHLMLLVCVVFLAAAPTFGQSAKRKKAAPARPAPARLYIPRVGSEAAIGKFRDFSTETVGGCYGIVKMTDVYSIVRLVGNTDVQRLKSLVTFQEIVVLQPGTRVWVGEYHQEMTKVAPPIRGISGGSLMGGQMAMESAPDADVPKPIGPPLAHVRVLDGPAKGQTLWVPVAYLAPPSSVPPSEAKKSASSDDTSETGEETSKNATKQAGQAKAKSTKDR